jgi:proton-dependent oligopeptide transporter, POT family
MFKGHPKGLFVLFFANMGERFGYYTMIAIFTLFLQAKYGFDSTTATFLYSIFLTTVYITPLLGGLIADKWLGYGKTVTIGIAVMFVGYLLLATPYMANGSLVLIYVALGFISLGTGLFKGNLQALNGCLYDQQQYSSLRDNAFTIFYMGINVGAMFAPTAAESISNFVLKQSHLFYDARIPALAHSFLDGKLGADKIAEYTSIAAQQQAGITIDGLQAFSLKYIDALSHSYHYGFGVACISLIASMLIFIGFRKHYKHVDLTENQKTKTTATSGQTVELTAHQTMQRMFALLLVFIVVIFFWMAFHQNGSTLTYFARDYTLLRSGKLMYILFDLWCLLPIFLSVVCLILSFGKQLTNKLRMWTLGGFAVFATLAIWRYSTYQSENVFTPQIFQHFNPFFIVALTPIVLLTFDALRKKGKEPSSPAKIGIGMLLAAAGYAVMIVAVIGLASPKSLNSMVSDTLVSPFWLIGNYFVLTVAELFLSPIGISFVSKVAPPKYKGLMQGGWFAATGIGNLLVGVIGAYWAKIELWQFFLIVSLAAMFSAGIMFAIRHRLEKAAQS